MKQLRRMGVVVALLGLAWGMGTPAWADANLALDKGCYACHGELPKKNAPTFAQLAQRYAVYRGVPGAEQMLANKLREAHVFGNIPAHQQLSPESAQALVRWIIDGAH